MFAVAFTNTQRYGICCIYCKPPLDKPWSIALKIWRVKPEANWGCNKSLISLRLYHEPFLLFTGRTLDPGHKALTQNILKRIKSLFCTHNECLWGPKQDWISLTHIDKNSSSKIYSVLYRRKSHRFRTTLGWLNDAQYTYDDKYIDTCTWELHGISVSVHSQVTWANLSVLVWAWGSWQCLWPLVQIHHWWQEAIHRHCHESRVAVALG